MEKIDRKCIDGGEIFLRGIAKLDEIVDWINRHKAGDKIAALNGINCRDSYEKGIRDAVHKSIALRELLIGAFVAETGALPSECTIVEETVGNKRFTRIAKIGD